MDPLTAIRQLLERGYTVTLEPLSIPHTPPGVGVLISREGRTSFSCIDQGPLLAEKLTLNLTRTAAAAANGRL